MSAGLIDRVVELAGRVGLVEAVRAHPELTVEELKLMCERGRGSNALRRLTLRQLTMPYVRWSDAELEQEIRVYFVLHPDEEHPAAYFGRRFAIPRWRAQRLLVRLEAAGHVERRGKTSKTLFSLRL